MKLGSGSTNTEGAVALIAAMTGLLAYGAMNEDIFALGGATVPAVALGIVLALSVADLVVKSGGLRQSLEDPLPVRDIFVGALACTIFALGLLYVGLIVSTAVALFASISFLRHTIQLKTVASSIGTALAIWVIFVYFGRAYLGQPWLF